MTRTFTKEQIEFVKDNCKGKMNQELTDLLNDKFGTSYTKAQISALKKRHKFHSEISCDFKKGNVP